jgi:hypothetical protein
MNIPKAGEVYVHFKDKAGEKPYKIIGIAKHTETEEEMVVYEPQYEGAWAPLVVRPLKMFMEEVDRDGVKQARFRKVK